MYGYNNLHYVARFVDAEGNLSHDEYDNLGNLIRRYSPRLCHQQGARGGNGAGYKYEYDYLDRLIKVTDPLGREKHYRRDGQGNILYESPLYVRHQIPERDENTGIRTKYDANSNATNIHCPDGGEWKRQYDANGNLLSESHPENPDSKRRYTYDSMNQVIMEEDEAGNSKQYRYDKKGRIVEEINALGHHTYYRYDLAGRLTGKWEYVGEVSASTEQVAECNSKNQYRVTQYIYDKAGNCIEERKGIEAVEPYEITYRYTKIKKTYDRQNRLIKVEDGEGAVTEYQYDLLNNKTSERYRINEKTEKLIRYSYDKTGRLTEKRETIDCGIKGAEKRCAITKYRYDIAGNLIEIKLPEGGVIRTLYDQADRPICQKEEDKQHGILRSRVYQYPDICPFPEEAIWGKEPNVKERNQILMESKEGESYGGEKLQRAIFQESPSTVRYYMGKKATSIYKAYQREYEDIQENKPDRGKDIDHGEAGKDYFERHNKYDFRGNLLEETDGEGNTFGYCYNKNGELTKIVEAEEYHKNGVEGAGTIFTYNSIGQLTSRSNGAGETEYRLSYDKLGRMIAETDGEGNKITYSYNPTGSLTKVTRGDGSIEWQATYDLWNRPDSTTDGNGNKTCYQKDRWGRITTIIKPDKTEEHYHYDYAGNIIKAVDALGRETIFHYTSQSLVSSITKADKTTEYFSYDREGRMSNRLNRNNCLTEIIWNIDSNPVSITGRRADPEEGFAYIKESAEDREGLRTIFHVEYPEPEETDRRIYTYSPDGILEKAAEAGTIYHYTHDRNGRMLTKTAWGKTLISCEYNKNGRIKSLETIGGKTGYEYDLAGRIQSITGKDGILAEYQYNSNGMQSEVRYGNGLSTSYSYDNRNQLSMLTASFPGKAPLLQANYAYDGNGNRVRKEETFGLPEPKARTHNITQVGLQDALQPELNTRMQNSVQPSLSYIGQNLQTRTEVTHYQYDSLNQLVAENRNNHHISYKYDAVGNRILQENNGIAERYSYNNRNQLVEKASTTGSIQYSYDVAGNLTEEQRYHFGTEETISYQYDVFNRNTTVQGAKFLQINRYDAEGYRYEVEENGLVSRFTYHYGMMLAELDKDNEVASSQYLGNEYVGGELPIKGSNAPDRINISNTKETCYYICDEQGSIRYVLNQNGEVKNYYQYSAFGENEVTEESCYSRLRYNSQIYDELTSQYYLRARYYQPQIGRFTQEDILYNDGLNLYAYCQNNSVMYSDPSGYAKVANGCDPKKNS